MSLTSTIRFLAEFTHARSDWYSDANGVGISTLDQNVYIWQLKEEAHSHCILVIVQVNPLVPSSWKVFKELKLGKPVNNLCFCFNAAGSKLAFRYRYYQYKNVENAHAQFELLLVDLTTGQTETRAIVQLPRFNKDESEFNSLIIEEAIKFAETSIGRVAGYYGAQQIFCYRMFPEPRENQILVRYFSDFYYWSPHDRVIGITYDSFMYIRLINSPGNCWKNCKLVSYDFMGGNSKELPFDDLYSLAAHTHGPFLAGNSEGTYLFRSGWPLQALGTRVYQIQQDHLGLNLQFLTRFDDEFIDPSNPIAAYDGKMVIIHFFDCNDDSKCLVFVNMTLPSLKSLAVSAIQKLHETMGKHGELLNGIGEEKLKNAIGYQGNKKLF